MTFKRKFGMFFQVLYHLVEFDVAEYRYLMFGNRKTIPEKEENIEGKVVVITGAGQGLGKATAIEFAKRKAIVVLGCVDMKQGMSTVQEIIEKTGNENVEAISLDLSDMHEVEKFAFEVSSKYPEIQILVNNGGIGAAPKGNEKTKQGFNLHIAVNYLGHFLLTNLLLDNLKRSKSGRVVSLSSLLGLFEVLNLKDFMMDKRRSMGPLNLLPYANSCFANSLFMKELGKRSKDQGVTTYSICPGVVKTQLWDALRTSRPKKAFSSFLLSVHGFTAEQAASEFVMHCSLSKKLSKETGEMYRFKRHLTSRRFNTKRSSELWDLSSQLVHLEERMSRLKLKCKFLAEKISE